MTVGYVVIVGSALALGAVIRYVGPRAVRWNTDRRLLRVERTRAERAGEVARSPIRSSPGEETETRKCGVVGCWVPREAGRSFCSTHAKREPGGTVGSVALGPHHHAAQGPITWRASDDGFEEIIQAPDGDHRMVKREPRVRSDTEMPCFPFAVLELSRESRWSTEEPVFRIEFLDDEREEVLFADYVTFGSAEEAIALAREVFGVSRDEWEWFESLETS